MRVSPINPIKTNIFSDKFKNNQNLTLKNNFQSFQNIEQKDSVSFESKLKNNNFDEASNKEPQILNSQDKKLVDKYNDSKACAALSKEEIIKAQRLENYYEKVKEIYDKLNAPSSKVALNRADVAKAIYLATKDCASKDETIESLTSNINSLIELLSNKTANDDDYSYSMEAYLSADEDKELSLLVAQVRDNTADKNYIEMLHLHKYEDDANCKSRIKTINNGFKNLKTVMG